MPASPPSPKKAPHSGAYLAFGRNLDYIADLNALRRREIAAAKAALLRTQTNFKKHSDLTNKKALKKMTGSVERHGRTLKTVLVRLEKVTLWQVVILVTCVEAYLQDVLSAAASADPNLIGKSEPAAPYADVVSAPSLEVLAGNLRARWARGWLNSGGPTRWIERLLQLGARGYPDDLATRLEQIWGIRHVVVHSAGIATADFVRLHPDVAARPGERIRISHGGFRPFLVAVEEFLEPTERFFITRYPSLPIAATESA